MRTTLLILIVLLTTKAFAADWYVKQGQTGNDDGTTYEHAWEDLLDVVWGGSGVVAGDTLYVCGTHTHTLTNSGNLVTQADVTIGADGTVGNYITIRGDHPGDPGIIFGSFYDSLAAWNDEGGGVWSSTLRGADDKNGDWFFADISGEDYTLLEKIRTEGTLTGTWTFTNANKTVRSDDNAYPGDATTELDDGDWIQSDNYAVWYEVDGEPADINTITIKVAYADDTDTNADGATLSFDVSANIAEVAATDYSQYAYPYSAGTIYVRLNGDEPTSNFYFSQWGYEWQLAGRSYIKFLNLTMYASGFNWGHKHGTVGAHHIIFDGCKLWYDMQITCSNNTSYITLTGCDCAYDKGAIWVGAFPLDGVLPWATDIEVSDCYIHDMGVRPSNYTVDAEGVSINAVSRLLVESNEFYNVGTGVAIYAYTANVSTNDCIVRYNFIHGLHRLGGARASGIEFSGGVSGVDLSGNEAYYNVLCGAGANSGVSSSGIKSKYDEEVKIYNNTVYAFWQSFSIWNDTPYVNIATLKNNISLYPQDAHIVANMNNAGTILISDNNLFYPDELSDVGGDGAEKSFYDGIAAWGLFADWQALSKAGSTFDPQSVEEDPVLEDVTGNMFWQKPDYPQIGGGVDVGLTRGRRGGPTTDPPDIGADNSGAVYLLF